MTNGVALWLACALSLLACSAEHAPDVVRDAGAPTADAAAMSGDAATLGSCAPLGSCPARSIGVWQELLEASDFGASARLVATGGLGVLVALDEQHVRVVRLAEPSGASMQQDWDFPHAGARGIYVPNPPDSMSVLTCGDSGSQCSVWQADVRSDELSAWRETVLPGSFVARGISQDLTVDSRPICVYGAGMVCDSQAVIPVADDRRLNAVAFGSQWSIAVGEHGRWWKREHGADWQEQPALNDVALEQVVVSEDGGAVIVGEGKLQAALGSQAALYDCVEGGDVAAFILDSAAPGLAYALTPSGLIVQHSSSYCAYQRLELSGPVLQSGTLRCGGSNNPRVLTASVLFGQNNCLEVP